MASSPCPKLPQVAEPQPTKIRFSLVRLHFEFSLLLSKGGKSPETTSDSPIKTEKEKPFPIHWVTSKVPEAIQHHDKGHPQPCSWIPRRFASNIMPGRRELGALHIK